MLSANADESGARYKLIDLSVAAVGDDARGTELETVMMTGTTGLARMIGTPHFMSPEQFQEGVAVTPQTDLWSLGVVVFAATSGVRPFGDTVSEQMKIGFAVVHTQPPKLVDMPDCRISEGLSNVVGDALKKDLARRFLTAVAMRSALRLATELPDHWAAMDESTNCVRVPVSREVESELWSTVERRIAQSLPDFVLVGMERVQNKALWQKYSAYHAGQEVTDESELFHYAKPAVLEQIVTSTTVSFDPRLGGGEYGAGSYFAQHALYCVAYSGGWLSDDDRS
eukprot:COSAG01_NODE_20118_length_969_cov_7.422989_1_plen_282_part_10